MGTRLYPHNASVELLEKLAGVPSGTYARLKAFETNKPAINNTDFAAEEEWYDQLFADNDLHAMHSFDLFGWGKLAIDASDYVCSLGYDRVCGDLKDYDEVQRLLALQGVGSDLKVEVKELGWS